MPVLPVLSEPVIVRIIGIKSFLFLHHLLKNIGSQRYTNVLGVLRQLRELFLTVAINGKDTKRRGDNDVFLAFYEEKRSEFGNVIIKSE